MNGSDYQLRATRTSVHIDGIAERTMATGNANGGAVSYYAQNACAALTRGGSRMQIIGSYEDLSEALRAAEVKAGSISGRRVCKTCKTAAEAQVEREAR